MTFWTYLFIASLVVIVPLAIYAGKLLRQLKQQKELQQQAEEERVQALNRHDYGVWQSIEIIVKAMQEEQCDLSEGCWRLSVLLDSLKLQTDHANKFPAVVQLYQQIKHMPILEARKKLTKKERMKLDFERMKLEAELQDDIRDNLVSLRTYSAEQLITLNQ